MDGVRGGGSSWVTISGNTFTNFHKIAYAHNDAIQFWTSGTTASVHDLVITNNTITQGSGDAVQGIFMNNEMGFTYEKVTITGNAIIGPGYHGITVEKANNITIEGNLIEGYKDLGGWIQLRNSSNVSLQHNVSTSWKLDNNTSIITSDNKTIALGDVSDTSILNYWKTHGHTVPDSAVIGSAPPGTTGGVTPPAPPVLPDADRLLIGASGSDTLLGGSGNDTLNDGSGGSDNLIGGAGNDTYIINSWGSLPNEKADGGIDTVRTALENHTLRTNVENLTLTGTSAQRGNGNAQDNVITGNAVKNQLSGGDGNDTLVSIGGVDTLTGGAGKDVFSFTKIPSAISTITDFTRGTDALDLHDLLASYKGTNPVADGWVKFTTDATGTTVYVDPNGPTGAGSFVAVAKLAGVTSALTGAELVYNVSASTAPAPAPTVDVTGGAGKLVTGTTAGEVLTGSSGADTIDGGGGADTMNGGAGDDVYIENSWGSYANETANNGIDTVRTSLENYTLRGNVENLVLTATTSQRGYGNAQDNVITGNGVKNLLQGMDGNDTLVSNGGVDTLTGGAGKDVFDFNKIPTTMANITDFTRGSDLLDLHDLLGAYKGSNPVADGWVKFSSDIVGTTVYVDANGPSGPGGFVAVAKLSGVAAMGSADWIF